MEDKYQAWFSLLEDSCPWNNSNTSISTQPNSFFSDRASSTLISSAIPKRTAPQSSRALVNGFGQLSPITATTPNIPQSKVSDSLTQYSISASDLTSNTPNKTCRSVPQSSQKCVNALQANDKPRLPIFSELLNKNKSKSSRQHTEPHSQQPRKDAHSTTQQSRERSCESKKKASTAGSLVFPFPTDQNLRLPNSKQKRTFESGLVNPLTSCRRDTPEVLSGLNITPDIGKSFPDLFNPSLAIRAEPAGRDIPQSINRPPSAPTSTDNKENKGPVPKKGHDNVVAVNPNTDIMNSVVIESASKEQVRYQKTPLRNIGHEELGASSVSSEEEMDTDISSKATGYASTLSTLLDYMSVDERVKLLPPSTLKTNAVPDLGGLSNDREDAGGRSPVSIDSGTSLFPPKGLSPPTKNEPLFTEHRSDLQPVASHPINQHIPEMDDFMMPPVGNRDNFIPVGSESNIQTMGINARSFRGVAVGGGGSSGSPTPSLGTQLDANIHITISRTSYPLDIDIDTLLPMEERERFLPTGADSESIDKATSSSGSNNSDPEDNVQGCYQVNNVLPNQGFTRSINLPMESVSYPPHELRELGLTRLVDTNLEGATASCQADNNPVQRSTEDYMDIVERQKFIKTDLRVPFDAGNDLPKNREGSTSQEPKFNGHFDFSQGLDNTNQAKSEPDLLLGHSLNFGICDPDLHQSIASGENLHPTGIDSLSGRRPNLDSDTSSEVTPSRNTQDIKNPTQPILLPVQSVSLEDSPCPVEGEEDDTDELIKMASSILIEPLIGNSCDKGDQTPAKQTEFKSSAGISDLSSTPTDNPHLSQTNLNDNVSTATSNQLTESGRGTLGSSDVSSSPLNMGDNSKTGEDQNSNNQGTSSNDQPPSSDLNAVSPKAENINDVQGLNAMISPESSQNLDKNSVIQNQADDNSLRSTSVHLPDSENSSLSTDLYLPLSTAVFKGSIDNTTVSEPNSARSYENDQSQDSDILGKQVNSLLCRTAYLEYRNQNAHTTKNESHEISLVAPRSATYPLPSPEAYKFDTSSLPAKSGYTEKEGLNYDQLEQDLTDLQNGLAQGMQLKNPILQDKDQGILNRSKNGIGHSANSPDVLQDSKLPTNLFRRSTQQADLLLGMDRILRKKEQAFDTPTASLSLPLLAGPLRNENLQMTCHEDSNSLKTVSRHPQLADFEMVSTAPNMATENKPKQPSEETVFLLPNQVSEQEDASSGVSLGNTQCLQHTPEVIDDLAIRVERILSEEPLYDMHKTNFLDKIRPKEGFFGKLSFDSSDQNSIKSDINSETCSSRVELPKSTNSVFKFPSNRTENQEFKEQDPYFENAETLENNTERICLGGSVASKESSENYQVSTLSDSSHSIGSLNKESSHEAPDSSVVQPSKNDLPKEGKASFLSPKTGNFDNSNRAFIGDQNKEEPISLHSINKDKALTEPVNFGHNETFPNLVNESANSTKFLEDDVRRCLDWSNMSTYSSPLIPSTQADNFQSLSEMVERISNTESGNNKPVPTATILNVPRNDLKRTSVYSESSITSSYVSSFSRSGSISGKSATSSSHTESDCHSSNTVASVCAVSAEEKKHESSNFDNNLPEQSNPHQRHGATSSSSSSLVLQNSSPRNLSQKSSANVSNQRIDPSFCSEDVRRSDNNLTAHSSQKLDMDFYGSSKSNDGLPKSPYKLSLSESQSNFHPKNQIQRRNTNKSCSDINALHSEDPALFLKPKDFTDSESLRRDLNALSNFRQLEEEFTKSSLERKTPKEGGDIASQPTSKSFPSVSPTMVVSPLYMEPHSVGAVSEQGDCGGLRGHSNNSNSMISQFYESGNPRGFVIGKTSSSSSSISSTNQSRNNSAQVQSLVSALKGKKHKKSGQMKSAEKLQTNVELKGPLDPQVETVWPISKGQSDGMEVNSPQSNTYQPPSTSSSSGSNTSSPLGSAASVTSCKTWTLRPYKPPGYCDWYYTGYSSERLASGESGTTTLESADTGSDDAIGPQIPKEFLGTRVDVPSKPGIYSRAINKKKIPVQEDNLYLSTILEKSFLDDRDRSNRISEKRNSQCLYNNNGYSAKGSTVDHGNVPASGTKSLPTEFKTRNKDPGERFCTPQRIEHLVSKENNSVRSLNQNISLRPLDFENSETKSLYDSCRLQADNAELCREEQDSSEKIVANRSVLDLPAKNQSSFESATTTVDTPSGFTTDPEYVTSGLRQFEPSFSSADSGQLQDMSGVAGQCHPMVRYAPTGLRNSPRATTKDVPVVNDQTKSKAPPPVCTKNPEILPQSTERVVRSSKELDLLWSKFKQQEHSDHDSSLDSERLEHMQQLLKNPTHAHVHQSLERIESSRLKQAKVAAHKMEEQKRALLRSKIQDESSSVLGSIYSNRDSSCNGTARRDGDSLSSRPSSSSDAPSSIAAERRVAQHQEVQSQGVPRGGEAGSVDPIMTRLRQKIDKQRRKCEQMKVRDKVSEQKLRKLTHILVNRQMNELILAAEMSSLSTTSTASLTTASETVPKSLRPNACKNQPEIPRRRTNPISMQQSDKSRQKNNHPPRSDHNGFAQNGNGQGKTKAQGPCSRSKQKNQRHREDFPETPISEQQSATDDSILMQRSRPKKRDVATMVPTPQVVSTETASDSEDSCYILKSSIGVQTSPPREIFENSQRANFLGPNHLLENQSSKVNTIQSAGSTISPHKSSVEEVQVIPVPFMSTPKRYKNLANKALYKTSGKKTSVDKANEAWFISLSDRSATSAHSPQKYQHHQSMGSFARNPKAVGRENKKKMNVRNQPVVSKKPTVYSHGLISGAAAPIQLVNGSLGLSENALRTLAITNEKADDDGNKVTLQEAFFNRMQSWISRSRERQKRISLAAEERRYQQQMELEREEMFLNRKPQGNNQAMHPFSDNLYKPKKRVLTQKEIRDLNKRLYKKLPEVVEQKVLLHRAKQYQTNRIRSRVFSMHVQKSLLTKATCR